MQEKKQKYFIITLILFSIYLSFQLINEFTTIISFIFKIIFPILLGFVFAFIFNPVVKFLVKRRISKQISVLITMIMLIGILVVIITFLIPNLMKELIKTLEFLPSLLTSISEKFENYFTKYFDLFNGNISLNINYDQLINELLSGYMGKITSFLQSIISYFFVFIISIIVCAYLLYDFEKIEKWLKDKTSSDKYKALRNFLSEMKYVMLAYFRGVLIVNFIMFILSALLFYLIDLKLYLGIALLFSITNLIPYIGQYIGGAAAVIVGLNTSPQTAIFALLIVILLQFFESYFLTPRIQGKNLNAHPCLVIISVFVMGSLFGIIGMLIAVPFLAFVQAFIKNFLINKRNVNVQN